ncbi:hypothetical protein [Leptolyngbya sp. Heron Island J]|uniref:hypothetical protein n=1 Tax=Leptolyngbya sp. Heron Island J TaxID=1385935 RepID=UPI001377A69F|nr:hypothetical protein [Leptolyngbya sp. Heron Island J]
MSLVEYLYVDHRRLDSYVEQFMSLQTFDKVPVWKAGMGLTGLRVEGTQQQQARPLTTHEKVMALNDYLTKGNHVSYGRWHGKAEKPPTFIIEECKATKIFIPAKDTSIGTFTGMTIWFSESGDKDAGSNLILLEDLLEYDQENSKPFYSRQSSYTWLLFLLDQVSKDIRASLGLENLNRRIHQYRRLHRSLLQGNLAFLRQFGCDLAQSREICTLYRIRDFCVDVKDYSNNSYDIRPYIAGYPIYIAEAGESALAIRPDD